MLETETRRRRVFTWLTLFFAIASPLAVIAHFGQQVARTGNVSHWPWEPYGFFGWWLVPLSFWAAAACSLSRAPGLGRVGKGTTVLAAVAAATSVALLYNP